MPVKSFKKGKRTLATTDSTQKIVTGKVEEYRTSSYFATKVQDAYITFKYYRWGDYMGNTNFYWHDISAGTLNSVSVASSNGNTYATMTSEHHTAIGQTWLTGTIDLASYETSGYGRLVVRHQASSNTSNFFTGDFQMDHIEIHSATGTTIDLDPDLYRISTANEFWQLSDVNTNWSSSMSWYDLSFGTGSFWNYDSGGTGSSNTGDSENSDGSATEYYIYTEVSGAASRYAYLQTKFQYDLFSGASL